MAWASSRRSGEDLLTNVLQPDLQINRKMWSSRSRENAIANELVAHSPLKRHGIGVSGLSKNSTWQCAKSFSHSDLNQQRRANKASGESDTEDIYVFS